MGQNSHKKNFQILLAKEPKLFLEKNKKAIFTRLKKECNISGRSFRRYWKELVKGELEADRKPKQAETVIASDEGYTFKKKDNSEIHIPLDIVDKCFFYYSRHGGLNYTQLQTQSSLELSAKQWYAIKRNLDLVKLSPPLSPYSLSKLPAKDRQDVIDGKVETALKLLPHVAQKKRQEKIARKYEKAVLKALDLQTLVQESVNEIEEVLSERVQVITAKKLPSKKTLVEDVVVVVSDLHTGSRIKWKRKDVFDTAVLMHRLDSIAETVNKHRAKRVHLLILGDLFEAVSIMHLSAIPHIEQNMMFNEGILKTYDILEAWVSKFNNLASLRCVSGNHDRMSMSKQVDSKGSGALLVYEMLKRATKNVTTDFRYHHVFESLYLEKYRIEILGSHGDRGITNKPSEFIHNHGNPDAKFTLSFSGHLHSRKVLGQGKRYIAYMAPALVEPNEYAIGLGKFSVAGYYEILFRDGKHILLDHPFYTRY